MCLLGLLEAKAASRRVPDILRIYFVRVRLGMYYEAYESLKSAILADHISKGDDKASFAVTGGNREALDAVGEMRITESNDKIKQDKQASNINAIAAKANDVLIDCMNRHRVSPYTQNERATEKRKLTQMFLKGKKYAIFTHRFGLGVLAFMLDLTSHEM